MVLTIYGTHRDDGTTMNHRVDTNDPVATTAWTIELMRHCGYTRIELIETRSDKANNWGIVTNPLAQNNTEDI